MTETRIDNKEEQERGRRQEGRHKNKVREEKRIRKGKDGKEE